MSENIERRKNAFKSTQANMTERNRKQTEQVRKERRSANILAKRLKPAEETESSIEVVYTETDVSDAMTRLKSGDNEVRISALRTLRSVLCSNTPHTALLIESGTHVLFSNLLTSPNEEVRLEAAWCLTNIAAGDHAETGAVLCAVPNMIEILNSNSTIGAGGDSLQLQDQICWALGNIAGDSDEHRAVLIANGALPAVLNFLDARVKGLVEAISRNGDNVPVSVSGAAHTAAWALSNLARGKVSAQLFIDSGRIAQLLQYIVLPAQVRRTDDSLLGEAVTSAVRAVAAEIWWLFAFLTAKEDAAVNALVQQGLPQALCDAFAYVSPAEIAVIPLVRCLGNLTSGLAEWVPIVMSDPRMVVALLACCAPSAHRVVIKEALWVASNILGGSPDGRSILLAYGSTGDHPSPLLEHLLHALLGDDFGQQQEAVLALEQACLQPDLLRLMLTTPQYAAQLLAVGRVFQQMLRAPGSVEAPFAVLRIVGALTDAAGQLAPSPGRQVELVNVWVDAGITEALDDMQYGAGSSACDSNGVSLGQVAAALVDQLYQLLERDEIGDDHGMEDRGPVPGQFLDAPAGGVGQNSGQFSFGLPADQQQAGQTVFSFGAVNGLEGNGGVGFGQGTPPSSPAGNGQGGMGRGSHLLRPSWMT